MESVYSQTLTHYAHPCTGLFTDESGHVQHSLGGFSYGRCMNYVKRKCLPCNPEIANPEYILVRCNAFVPECLGRCNLYADL
ncbi:hypothetical protein DUNSADRAFT_8802 [Dunaliella salina]|uniref:Uncharacterized protein n=1 Tax=Dunaliella salina TaxID=3046 RepID=A0ABQ7GIV4_DUNSA|nr:hypothetical protein DUNSADRAFT_8802 [Dunaliella salina]|eukprot:KAF5834509.1 hypothetical protein DUNSADRAFT_8802 [Dunaliella salina]